MIEDEQAFAPSNSLDGLDQNIIDLLRVDGRMSFREIAQRLDLPEATARYRVQRLLHSGAIKVLAWPDPAKMGTPNLLILWLTVEHTQIETVAETLAQLEEVRFVAMTTGRCNLVVDVYFGAHEKLFTFFSNLHQIQGIIKYESQTVIKLLKAEYTYTLN